MCPYTYYTVMRKSKDPRYLRHQIVLSADKRGIKATARSFSCSRNTVRKWYRRWLKNGYKGLIADAIRVIACWIKKLNYLPWGDYDVPSTPQLSAASLLEVYLPANYFCAIPPLPLYK